MNSVFKYFPEHMQRMINEQMNNNYEELEEIRVRVGKPIILKFNNFEQIIRYFVSSEEILDILQAICENSIYSYQKQIAEGFITIRGGHRVGISGSCVIQDGKVININYVNSLNFRISRQIYSASKEVLKYILDLENNNIYNTIIVSPAGSGKTTLLKDIIRQVSNGIKNIEFKGLNVGVVDERGEIAALYKGKPENDIGIKTDIIENVSKSIGMKMLIRSMAPQVIVADEIGSIDDIEAINYAVCSGCRGIFTAHGDSFEDLILNPILKKLINMNIFEVIIILDNKKRGEIKDVYILNKSNSKYEKYIENNRMFI